MKRIKVNLNERSYDILIGNKFITQFGSFIRKAIKQNYAIVITNPVIARLYTKGLKKVLKKNDFSLTILTIPEGEKAKSLFHLNRILNKIAKGAKAKKPFIIAFGGGVVGDVAGFVSSIYKRGIPYVQIPTTLLAQIDSSIGGKTAVDLSSGKNLVGSFYQPALVLCDTNFLKSLPQREISSGLAEMIKYALIKDGKFFTFLEKHYWSLLKLNPTYLEAAISRCVKIKADIVSKDEKEEAGLRTILNFGHTVGHGIETATNFRYSHGESVGLGMLAALKISRSLNLINSKTFGRIFKLVKNCRLPTKIKKISSKRIMKVIAYDKKFIGKLNRFVLLRKIGKVIIKRDIKDRIIRQALNELG